MVINLTAVALFAVAWFFRAHPEIGPEPIIVAVETTGALLIGYGGMLGGKLVANNMIGVDSKFAAGGRWSEITVDVSGAVVASKDELLVDQMKLVRLQGKRIVVARVEPGYVAFDARCPHHGGSLAGGMMICGTVQCPWHGSQFDVSTGAVVCGPAEKRIDTYRVEETDAGVRLHLS